MEVRPIILLLSLTSVCSAQWQLDGIPVCDTSANSGFYMLPQIASDGYGGAFVCWRDARSGGFDIYMQHIYSNGSMQFPHNGTLLCDAPYSQQFPRMISDGRGGSYIAWEDDRSMTNTHIYVQRIDSAGQALWTLNGVRAAETGGLFISLALEPRTGGVLLGWSTVADAYVQRLDSLGNRMWGDSGVQVTNRPGTVRAGDVAVITDGNGGMVVAWAEGISSNYEVFVQHIDSSGTTRWLSNGVFLGVGGGVTISNAGNGASIVTRISNLTTYIQKINAAGQLQWGVNGLYVGAAGGRHFEDGFGGAVVWYGNKVQRFDVNGLRLFDTAGVNYTTELFPTSTTGIIDRNRGFWILWSHGGASLNIYGQYFDIGGSRRWDSSGSPVCTATNIQDYPRASSNDSGQPIVVWDDFRNGHSNIYAASVDRSGVVTSVDERGDLIPIIPQLNKNYPNPFNPETTISFSLPSTTFVTLKVYDVLGREVATLVQDRLSLGWHEVRFSGKSIPSGFYFYRLTTQQTTMINKMLLVR